MKQAKVLSDKELKRVLVVAGSMRYGQRNKLVLHLSHYCGLRVAEISHLKVSDAFNSDGSVRDRMYIKASYVKGQKQGRTIMLNTKVIKALSGWRQDVNLALSARLSARALHPDAPLIASQKRRHFSPNSLCQAMKSWYEAAAIEGASSHSGRRGFITRLSEHGVSPLILAKIARHNQIQTTMRYCSVSDQMQARAVELL